VELYLDYGDAVRTKEVFDALAARKDQIEALAERPLSWERLDQRQASRVALYTEGSADLQGEELDALLDRLVEYLLLFRRIFPAFINEAEKLTAPASSQDRGAMPPTDADR
jgi:hypothetical protein